MHVTWFQPLKLRCGSRGFILFFQMDVELCRYNSASSAGLYKDETIQERARREVAEELADEVWAVQVECS
jgi:hypothetical protein